MGGNGNNGIKKRIYKDKKKVGRTNTRCSRVRGEK